MPERVSPSFAFGKGNSDLSRRQVLNAAGSAIGVAAAFRLLLREAHAALYVRSFRQWLELPLSLLS
jgi:hypothetical protein